jgi:CO dehydrogenase maturation factor
MCRTHATVRRVLTELVAPGDAVTLVDMEAGLEHLSRGTTRASDAMLVVAEPYFKSLETARRSYALAQELGIPRVRIVANKVRGARDDDAIRAFCERNGLAVLTSVPYDEAVVEAEVAGQAPLDASPNSAGVAAIGRLADAIARL